LNSFSDAAVAVAGDATKDVSVEQGEQVSPQTRHMAVSLASKADTDFDS
jgi:hypothetical protein